MVLSLDLYYKDQMRSDPHYYIYRHCLDPEYEDIKLRLAIVAPCPFEYVDEMPKHWPDPVLYIYRSDGSYREYDKEYDPDEKCGLASFGDLTIEVTRQQRSFLISLADGVLHLRAESCLSQRQNAYPVKSDDASRRAT